MSDPSAANIRNPLYSLGVSVFLTKIRGDFLPVPRTSPPARQRQSLPLWGRWHGVSRDGRGSSPPARQRQSLPLWGRWQPEGLTEEGRPLQGTTVPFGHNLSRPLTGAPSPKGRALFAKLQFIAEQRLKKGLPQYFAAVLPGLFAITAQRKRSTDGDPCPCART